MSKSGETFMSIIVVGIIIIFVVSIFSRNSDRAYNEAYENGYNTGFDAGIEEAIKDSDEYGLVSYEDLEEIIRDNAIDYDFIPKECVSDYGYEFYNDILDFLNDNGYSDASNFLTSKYAPRY